MVDEFRTMVTDVSFNSYFSGIMKRIPDEQVIKKLDFITYGLTADWKEILETMSEFVEQLKWNDKEIDWRGHDPMEFYWEENRNAKQSKERLIYLLLRVSGVSDNTIMDIFSKYVKWDYVQSFEPVKKKKKEKIKLPF